jgi:hypothetical protein
MNLTTTERPLVDRLLEPLSRCIRGEGERELLTLRADATLQARIDELADKCDEGALTADERAEYETYVRYGNFVAILQASASVKSSPRRLDEPGGPPRSSPSVWLLLRIPPNSRGDCPSPFSISIT